ncbi:MAG: DoxX family protein [Pseudobdellovibrionaceae bacterium]
MKYFTLFLRILSAAILLQTLFFKFSAAPESVWIFTQLHAEPFGRWFAGASELVAAALLLIPATQGLGALASVGIMTGAILSHLFVLGINVQEDGGLLFGLALTVLLSGLILTWLNRQQLIQLLKSIQTAIFK